MYLSRWIMQQRTVPYFLINKITYILKMSMFLRINLKVCSIYTELFSFWSISLIKKKKWIIRSFKSILPHKLPEENWDWRWQEHYKLQKQNKTKQKQ